MSEEGTTPRLEIFDEADIDAALDAAIKRLLVRCFPADEEAFSRSRYWHGSAPAFTVVLRSGETVVGHVGVVEREVSCGDRSVRVAGVESLSVAPAERGSGLGSMLMSAAMEEARRRGIRHGLLFCVPELESFYARMGWRRLAAEVNMEYPPGRVVPIPAKNVPMCATLTDPSRGELPPGPVHLNGPDW